MKTKELVLNDHRVLVVDAPENATHADHGFYDGANYLVYRKGKLLELHCFDQSKDDSELIKQYEGKLLNVGSLKIAEEGVVANLFNPVKNGNFYDYEYNGVFYPSAVSALQDVVDQEMGYSNPYVLIIKQ